MRALPTGQPKNVVQRGMWRALYREKMEKPKLERTRTVFPRPTVPAPRTLRTAPSPRQPEASMNQGGSAG
jgi:hypothetical protein